MGAAVTDGPDAALVSAALSAAGEEPGVVRLARIPGGASREVYLAESEAGRWVLRRDPPGAESFTPLAVEHQILGAAAAAGVPVPRPIRFEGQGGSFGSAGFLMEHVAGDSVAPRLLRREEYESARRALPEQLGRALARIHAIDPRSVTDLPMPEGDPAIAACELWESEIDRVGENFRLRTEHALTEIPVGDNWFLEYMVRGAYEKPESRLPVYLRPEP